MLFNSLDFALFLPIVFVLYWFVFHRSLRVQNLFVVFASYVFYGWWDWRFLILLFLSTAIDYWAGLRIHRSSKLLHHKIWLWVSILVNLGMLGFFKYYNFFVDSFAAAFSLFGKEIQAGTLHIILPMGISFYTFQTMSYTIDVYRKKLKPTKDFVAFTAFVSFFPQLVAGPIERAINLLPQFYKKRIFDYSKATDGLRQILWGLFKKVVIADNCGYFVNEVFAHPQDFGGSSIAFALILFVIQIYGDFSGYSDIAIGSARLFGFKLNQNFAFPLFSRNIRELWTRWHISLSSWFRDYVFFPLGGLRKGKIRGMLNLLITFILVGFWHGANWNFIIFGFLQGFFIIFNILTKSKTKGVVAQGKIFPSLKELTQMLMTFLLFSFTGIFFRRESVVQSVTLLKTFFSKSLFSFPSIPIEHSDLYIYPNFLVLLVILFFLIEWKGRENQHPLEKLFLKSNKFIRYTFYYGLIIIIFWMSGEKQDFYYFQF